MNKTKKILLISSLTCVGITCLFFILAIFGIKVFDGVMLKFLLIFASLGLGFGIAINEINLLNRNKILGIVSLSFLCVSILFALIIFCSPLLEEGSVFNTITAIFALFSIFFMIIISLYTKLGKKMLVLQIITYIVLCIADIMVSILIAGYSLLNVPAMTEIFSIICVFAVGLMIALSIISSKNALETSSTQGEYVKLLKTDYDNLIKENQELKEKIEQLTKKINSI